MPNLKLGSAWIDNVNPALGWGGLGARLGQPELNLNLIYTYFMSVHAHIINIANLMTLGKDYYSTRSSIRRVTVYTFNMF